MKVIGEEEVIVEFTVTPQMTNQYGAISYGAFTTLLTEVGINCTKKTKTWRCGSRKHCNYYIKTIQMDNVLKVVPHILDM